MDGGPALLRDSGAAEARGALVEVSGGRLGPGGLVRGSGHGPLRLVVRSGGGILAPTVRVGRLLGVIVLQAG